MSVSSGFQQGSNDPPVTDVLRLLSWIIAPSHHTKKSPLLCHTGAASLPLARQLPLQCRIQVQGCEQRWKQPKHLISSKRSWTRKPRKTLSKVQVKQEGSAAERDTRAEWGPRHTRMDTRFDGGWSFSDLACFFTAF